MLLALTLASQTWTMVVGGDIMLNGVRPSPNTFAGIKPWTTKADIAVANLEIPLTDSRTATVRKTAAELRARQQYILKADPGHAKWIADAGFDVVSLGNNHALDYGPSGLKQMQGLLDKNGIKWCGAGSNAASALTPKTITLKSGMRVAFLSLHAFRTDFGLWKCTPATATSAGVATLGGISVSKGGDVFSRRIKSIVKKAKSNADFLVVSLHWGTEKRTVPDLYQAQLGRRFIEAGADCVLGSHPHVLQGAESYVKKPLFYSLGNLVSPRPATTGIFRLTYEGKKLVKTEMLPLAISGGKVAPVKNTAARVSAFNGLSRTAVAKYRHPKAAVLPVK